MSVGHSTVYRKTSPATAKAYRRATMERELAAWTEDISDASPELGRRLLAEKQAALQLLHPPRPAPVPSGSPPPKKPNKNKAPDPLSDPLGTPTPDQIKDPRLRSIHERSKRQAEAEHIKNPTPARSYAHGMSMAATLEKVCMRPDITWRAKNLAVILSAHFPRVRPSNQRLRLLTGYSKRTIERGLTELNLKGLLTWKRGGPRRANEYTCQWLHP